MIDVSDSQGFAHRGPRQLAVHQGRRRFPTVALRRGDDSFQPELFVGVPSGLQPPLADDVVLAGVEAAGLAQPGKKAVEIQFLRCVQTVDQSCRHERTADVPARNIDFGHGNGLVEGVP